ncbi:hypothetical protein [Shewanella sp. GXUN23E]
MEKDFSNTNKSHHDKRLFKQHWLEDAQALKAMSQQDKFETGGSRYQARP